MAAAEAHRFSLAGLLGLLLVCLAGATPPEQGPESWLKAGPGFPWSFPRDHWSHPETRSEWWYLTGQVETSDPEPRRFGYQFTFFRVGLLRSPPRHSSEAWRTTSLIMGHAALSDLDRKDHRFSELVYRAVPALGGFGIHPDPEIAWSLGPPGSDQKWTLGWNGKGFDISMRDRARGFAYSFATKPTKPRIFQGPEGVSQKSRDGLVNSLYYSFPRLQTRGTVELDGVSHPVLGTSWFDKEFGSGELGPDQAGWDWFSLQLDDGRDLMIYLLRSKEGGLSHGRGTLVSPEGEVRFLAPEQWKISPRGSWASPEHDAVYPSGWSLRLPEERIDLTIEPAFPDQENRSQLIANMAYWEGAVRLTDSQGKPAGQGYVELTGYGTSRRPTR